MAALSATITLALMASAMAQNEFFCNKVLDEAILTDNCVLKEYQQQDVTECLTLLSKQRISTNQSNVIYFVGDSRIRQQFFCFLEVKFKFLVERVFKSGEVDDASRTLRVKRESCGSITVPRRH